MPHDPFQAPDLNDVHRRILDAVGFKVPASANLDDARDALEDHYLAMKRGPERDRFETAFTLMVYGDVVDGKPEGQTQSKIRALEQSGKTAHSRGQEMKKKSSERGAGSDGNYMTKQNLWLLHRMTELLYKGIPDGVLLPDWAESKINSAADHIKAVAGWAIHESHGDDLHPAPEANPIHLAARSQTYTTVRDFSWKDGTVTPKGASVTVTYFGPSKPKFAMINHDGVSHTTAILNLPSLLKGFPKVPSVMQMAKWSDEGYSKTPSGDKVEEDGYGSDNAPSWHIIAGVI